MLISCSDPVQSRHHTFEHKDIHLSSHHQRDQGRVRLVSHAATAMDWYDY